MSIYKTVIIEDNPDNAAVLRRIITENHPDLTIVAEANSVASAKEILVKHQPDMAFMDIELTPGTSFDVLADLNTTQAIGFEIIFITAHQRYDYATRAIDFSSLAFLSKPIDPEILRGAIEKAKDKQTRKIQIDQLLAKLQDTQQSPAKIIIPTTNGHKVAVLLPDILYFKADRQTTNVHLADGSIVVAFKILGHFKKMLMEEHSFFLVHHGLLLNVEQVQAYKSKGYKITLKNGEILTAARRAGTDFRTYWATFNGKEKGGLWQGIKNMFREKHI
jgi:two-component system, LytTR family, response regulator